MYVVTRPRRHRRLPPDADPPRPSPTYKPVQYVLAILGSMAVQGPVISWVADHRKHHAHTDQEGDPHSPHGHGERLQGRAEGPLVRAHGLAVRPPGPGRVRALRRDLVEDRGLPASINALFPLWVALGIAIPAALGWAIERHARRGAVTGALWGGAVRDLPAAPRHVVDQLRLPLLRLAALRGRRPLDQRVLARPALLRRVLAPQPPRVPALGDARAALVGGRSDGLGDPRDEGDEAGLERRRDQPRAPGARSSRRSAAKVATPA